MEKKTETTFAEYSGKRAHLYDFHTREQIGIIFVYSDKEEQYARFLHFNKVADKWCFSELPEVFVDDPDRLTSLRLQLAGMNIKLLLHDNDRMYFAETTTKPHYVQ
jgi:hypothetical protein